MVLFFQFRAYRNAPLIYWRATVLISVVGILITDNLTGSLRVSLEISTMVFSIALAATFATWYGKGRSLSIRTISTT